jgi:acyl-CoA synthetase (NDP forming)
LIEAVQQCIDAGVKAGIALAGGFSESSAEGRERQAQLKKLCDAHGFVLCGPNCIGIINTAAPMAATFASALITTDALLAGNISIVSQSGGIATLAQTLAAEQGYGVRSVVSSGNEAVTTTAQYIEAFSQDPGTKVICVYIEGLIDSARFMAALAQARDAGQIVVLLKAGATPLSAVAALAHNGTVLEWSNSGQAPQRDGFGVGGFWRRRRCFGR